MKFSFSIKTQVDIFFVYHIEICFHYFLVIEAIPFFVDSTVTFIMALIVIAFMNDQAKQFVNTLTVFFIPQVF